MKQKTIKRIAISSMCTLLMAAVITIASIIKASFELTGVACVSMVVVYIAGIIFFTMENRID